jgi:hypothetical protein
MLKGRGIELIAANHPQSSVDDSPTARLVRQLLGAVAEFDEAMNGCEATWGAGAEACHGDW